MSVPFTVCLHINSAAAFSVPFQFFFFFFLSPPSQSSFFPHNGTLLSMDKMLKKEKWFHRDQGILHSLENATYFPQFSSHFNCSLVPREGHLSPQDGVLFFFAGSEGSLFPIKWLCRDCGVIWTDSIVSTGEWVSLDPDSIRRLSCPASLLHLWFRPKIMFYPALAHFTLMAASLTHESCCLSLSFFDDITCHNSEWWDN